MPLYVKDDTGHWSQVQRPYVNRNGVWTAASEAWIRASGTWQKAYEYDVTPPNPPELDLQVYEDWGVDHGQKQLQSRWLRVGVRLPGSLNDPDAKLTRVLTTYNGKAPTTPLGGTYTAAPDNSFPNEPWSEWRYNEFGPHNDSSVLVYKEWPRNAAAGTIIKGDTDYFFGAWSLDRNGNWSVAVQQHRYIPKDSVDLPNIVVKEARFQPNASGSWAISQPSSFTSGDLLQQTGPTSTGVWFYGEQMSDSIGSQGAPTIRSAQMYIVREDDIGTAMANIYLYWTPYPTVASLPASGSSLDKHEITKMKQLGKGEGAWFDLPTSFYPDLAANIKGLGLDFKDPQKASAYPNDYSVVYGVASRLRCGEVHVVWEEEL